MRLFKFNQFVVNEIKFSDGMEFDTSGELHTEERGDGWYVVGNGKLIPVDSKEAGEDLIEFIKHKQLKESESELGDSPTSKQILAEIEKHKAAQRDAENKLNRLPVTKFGGAKNQEKADELARKAAYHESEWRRLSK